MRETGKMWVKLKYAKVKLCVVVVHEPSNERSANEKDRFWNELGRVVDASGKSAVRWPRGGLVIE